MARQRSRRIKSRPSRRRSSRKTTKLSTQLGRLAAIFIVAGVVWLFDYWQGDDAGQSKQDNRSAAVADVEGSDQAVQATTAQAVEVTPPTQANNLPENQFPGGLPIAANVQVLDNIGYDAGYSAERQMSLWVAYELVDKRQTDKLERPDRFETDNRVADPVEYYDYSRSGYTRGHLAPSYAIGKSHGQQAQYETFLMTNITPQLESLNRKWWQRLEEVEISRFTRKLNQLWVITGPVFDQQRETLKSGVDIPDQFYKIILAEKRDGSLRALAFLVPQTAKADEPLSRYLTTIDNIEQQTGIDFLAGLRDAVEAPLEQNRTVDSMWGLSQVDNLPARY